MKEFDQDTERVIAAYNAGENAVKRYNGVPPFSETREYLRRVNILYKRYASAIWFIERNQIIWPIEQR